MCWVVRLQFVCFASLGSLSAAVPFGICCALCEPGAAARSLLSQNIFLQCIEIYDVFVGWLQVVASAFSFVVVKLQKYELLPFTDKMFSFSNVVFLLSLYLLTNHVSCMSV